MAQGSEPDVIIVGAGISGIVVAEQIASRTSRSVVVLEQREHIGGNCHDYVNQHGIIIHKYGPHLFHTNKERVWQYLSRFTEWHPYEHKVLTRVDGQLAPLPFNLNTLHALFEVKTASALESLLLQHYAFGEKVSILELKGHDDARLKALGEYVYQKLFVNYTTKQWGCAPEQISETVIGRVPVVISRDDRYFHDRYQAIPKAGYTEMFKAMLCAPSIQTNTGVDAIQHITLVPETGHILYQGKPFSGQLVYTGMLDQLCGYAGGDLPYRSLQFEYETLRKDFFQQATTVNYPNEERFTRITEFKRILPSCSEYTTIVREYPQDFDRHDPAKNVPYYPILNEDNLKAYTQYANYLARFQQLTLLGRLAQYRYFNMDDAVEQALVAADRLVEKMARIQMRDDAYQPEPAE